MKAMQTPVAIIIGFVFVACVIGGAMWYTTQSIQETTKETSEVSKTNDISAFYAEFNAIAIDGSDAQDAEADVDIDIFEWDASKNSNLKSKGYLDCGMATPAKFDGTKTTVDIPSNAYCDINQYKFWGNAGFTVGDTETKVDDYLTPAGVDREDVDGGGNTTKLDPSKVYLVTVGEGATTDDEDVIPIAFLIGSEPTTTLDPSDLAAETATVRYQFRYYSDAGAHSKLKFGGSWEDDQDNSGDLDSDLNGTVDSTLTTNTSIKLSGTIEVEVKEDGYALVLLNPLATSNTERGYLNVNPYGETDNGGSETWIPYGSGNLTGDVGYPATLDSTSDQIIWSSSAFCGADITTSSSTDAVSNGNENLYEPSCFDTFAERKNGIYGLFDDGATMEIQFSLDDVQVDYDAATGGQTETVECNSGSSGENLFDISLVTVESTTDRMAKTLGC